MPPPLPNSAHGDQLISAKPRGTARFFKRPSYVTRWRRTGWLGRVDSNLCISESEFAKTLSLGGGIRTSAYRNHLNGGFGPSVGRLRLFSGRTASFEMR